MDCCGIRDVLAAKYERESASRGWSVEEMTKEQRRVLDWLLPRLSRPNRVLLVGTGNPKTLREFPCTLDTITLSKAEADAAVAAGFHALLVNKYDGDALVGALEGGYDYIVDAHLAGYGCCDGHVLDMLLAYKELLTPWGVVVTDVEGMAYRRGDGEYNEYLDERAEDIHAPDSLDAWLVQADAGLVVRVDDKLVTIARRETEHV